MTMRGRSILFLASLVWCAITCLPLNAHDMPPLELIDSNVAQTPYTAQVRIESVDAASNSDPGHVTFHVHARVVKVFKGDAGTHVDYFETHEAPSKGPRAGADILVSLDQRRDGGYAVPDNGYVFPATPQVLERARRAADTLMKRSSVPKS
jgi:hypothetical protein